jgi:hypothetical protein
MVIKQVRPVSCGKIFGLVYMVLGLIMGGFFSMISMAGGFASESDFGAGVGAMVGLASIIVFPLLYGAIGFVATIIGALLYNIAAGIVGGIEVDVQ